MLRKEHLPSEVAVPAVLDHRPVGIRVNMVDGVRRWRRDRAESGEQLVIPEQGAERI